MATPNDPWSDFRTGSTPAPQQGGAAPVSGEGVFIPAPGASDREQRERAAAGREQQRLGISFQEEQRASAKDVRDRVQELRNAYEKNPHVQKYEGALPNYVAALKTKPEEDLTLLYLYAKTIDPQSTVGASDMENINAADARLPAAVQTALRELRASNGKFTDQARDSIRAGLLRVVSQYNTAYNEVRDRYTADAESPTYNVDPNLIVHGHFGDRYYNDIQDYWEKRYKQKPQEIPEEYKVTTQPGGAGPVVSVTPEESIALFGEFTGGKPGYDAQGNIVGRNYAEAGNQVYDAQGNPVDVGVFTTVTEEVSQERAPSFIGGVVSDIGESITGSERATPTTEALPDWVNMPELQQLMSLPSFKANLGTLFGGGPQEIAQIVQSNFPGTKVFQDAKGNYILQSPSTGQQYAIKPGFQVSDIPRMIGTALLASEGAGARGALGVAGREAAVQTGIESTQAMTGGTFNPEDIAMAGALGAGGQKLAEVLPGAVRTVRGLRRGEPSAAMAISEASELPGGIITPSGGVTPPPAAAMPVEGIPAATVAPRVFEAGETVGGGRGAAGAAATPQETIRVQRAEELPVPVNLARFQKTRAFEDMQRARELAKNNEVGGPIRERMAEQQQQIASNFDAFLERTGSELWNQLEEQGVSVSNALERMAKRDKTRINALYKKARNSEEAQTVVPVSEQVEINVDGEPFVGSVIDYLNAQPTGVPSSSVSDTARQFAVNLGIATRGPDGRLVAANPTVGSLENFRREMSGISVDATGRRQEKIIKDLVDAHTEPYAGALYKDARAARRQYADRYENMSLISGLLSTKKNSPERVIAADRVVDRLLSSTTDIENLRQLKNILQSDKNGQQAWREIQGATIEGIRNKAYPAGSVKDEAGNQVVAPAAFAREIARLDRNGKLDVIFDGKTANQLRILSDVAQDVFTAPPGSVNFSNTSSGWLNAADAIFNSIISYVPLGDGVFTRILGPAAKYVFKAKERKVLKREVRELLD